MTEFENQQMQTPPPINASICFITAIYGSYEATCKPFVEQTVPTDFICFTDNPAINANGWQIDTIPYHITHPSPLDNGTYCNSICNNSHTFNICKYYKQAFRNIPRLQQYEVIVWLDGTVQLIHDLVSAYILDHVGEYGLIGWNHEWRYGSLAAEVADSSNNIRCKYRYCSTFWNGQNQPYQDVLKQYNDYLEDGYSETYFKEKRLHQTPHMGVWITCFLAMQHKNEKIQDLLDLWYLQTLKYTTQDQIGFPYACQKMEIIPRTLPDEWVWGDYPHDNTMFYIKHDHGK